MDATTVFVVLWIFDHCFDRYLPPFDAGDFRPYHQDGVDVDWALEFRVHLNGEAAPRDAFSRHQKADPPDDVVHDAAHATSVNSAAL